MINPTSYVCIMCYCAGSTSMYNPQLSTIAALFVQIKPDPTEKLDYFEHMQKEKEKPEL